MDTAESREWLSRYVNTLGLTEIVDCAADTPVDDGRPDGVATVRNVEQLTADWVTCGVVGSCRAWEVIVEVVRHCDDVFVIVVGPPACSETSVVPCVTGRL